MTREGGSEVDVLVAAWNRADIDDGSADNTVDCVSKLAPASGESSPV
jgi:hypothetical protein